MLTLRSFLFVPASSERFITKAPSYDADAFILDLEDSVIAEQKSRARARLRTAVPHLAQRGARVFVRVNSTDELLDADCEEACRAGADGIFLPKARSAQHVRDVAEILERTERLIGVARAATIVPMIEEANAVLDARSIASADRRVLGLFAGAEDLAASMNATPTPGFLQVPLFLVHLAAKAAAVQSFGLLRTVADYKDLPAISLAVAEARAMGFDGAACVHPTILPILNGGFSPAQQEIDDARELLNAYDRARTGGAGACVFQGRMVDDAMVGRARNVLAAADRSRKNE